MSLRSQSGTVESPVELDPEDITGQILGIQVLILHKSEKWMD